MKWYSKTITTLFLFLLFCSLVGAAAAQNETVSNNNSLTNLWPLAICCFAPLILIILSVAFGVWMYRDAERRGEDGAVWLIVGLVGNVIGLLIWLVFRPDIKTYYETTTIKEDSHIHCPVCGKAVSADAKICPHCGEKL